MKTAWRRAVCAGRVHERHQKAMMMDCRTILKKEQAKKLLYCCGMDVALAFVIVVLLVEPRYRGGGFVILLLGFWALPLFFALKEMLYFPILWKIYLRKETEQWAHALMCERQLPAAPCDPAAGYAAYCEAVGRMDGIDGRAKAEAAALGGFFAGRLDSRQPMDRRYFQSAIDTALATYLRERQ